MTELTAERVSPTVRDTAAETFAELYPEEELDAVGDEVIAVADRYEGFVLESSLTTGDQGTTGGNFELRVPADALQAALRDLSELGEVRARTQAGEDVTRGFVSAVERLTAARAERCVGSGRAGLPPRLLRPRLCDHAPMGEDDDTAALLARTEVFADLEQRELDQLATVAVPRHWERGELVFREGDSGDSCYVLRSGALVLTREHGDGRAIALAELRAGSMFGELALFGGERRSATAEALEETEAVALLRPDVQRLVRSHPDIALKLLSAMAERVRHTNERLLQQSFQTVAGRVAMTLLAQARARSAEGAGERDVVVRATQAEIANLAGTSRESASRFLASLERDGLVALGRGRVTVHEPERLSNYVH